MVCNGGSIIASLNVTDGSPPPKGPDASQESSLSASDDSSNHSGRSSQGSQALNAQKSNPEASSQVIITYFSNLILSSFPMSLTLQDPGTPRSILKRTSSGGKSSSSTQESLPSDSNSSSSSPSKLRKIQFEPIPVVSTAFFKTAESPITIRKNIKMTPVPQQSSSFNVQVASRDDSIVENLSLSPTDSVLSSQISPLHQDSKRKDGEENRDSSAGEAREGVEIPPFPDENRNEQDRSPVVSPNPGSSDPVDTNEDALLSRYLSYLQLSFRP